jgi:ribonuclease D
VLLKHVFDTQVAAKEIGTLTGNAIKSSYNHMLEVYLGKTNTYKQDIRMAMKDNECFWSQRPMKDNAIRYAALDVVLLLEAYENIVKVTDDYEDSSLYDVILDHSAEYIVHALPMDIRYSIVSELDASTSTIEIKSKLEVQSLLKSS